MEALRSEQSEVSVLNNDNIDDDGQHASSHAQQIQLPRHHSVRYELLDHEDESVVVELAHAEPAENLQVMPWTLWLEASVKTFLWASAVPLFCGTCWIVVSNKIQQIIGVHVIPDKLTYLPFVCLFSPVLVVMHREILDDVEARGQREQRSRSGLWWLAAASGVCLAAASLASVLGRIHFKEWGCYEFSFCLMATWLLLLIIITLILAKRNGKLLCCCQARVDDEEISFARWSHYLYRGSVFQRLGVALVFTVCSSLPAFGYWNSVTSFYRQCERVCQAPDANDTNAPSIRQACDSALLTRSNATWADDLADNVAHGDKLCYDFEYLGRPYFGWLYRGGQVPCSEYSDYVTGSCHRILTMDPNETFHKLELRAEKRLVAFEGQFRRYLGRSKDLYFSPIFASWIVSAFFAVDKVRRVKRMCVDRALDVQQERHLNEFRNGAQGENETHLHLQKVTEWLDSQVQGEQSRKDHWKNVWWFYYLFALLQAIKPQMYLFHAVSLRDMLTLISPWVFAISYSLTFMGILRLSREFVRARWNHNDNLKLVKEFDRLWTWPALDEHTRPRDATNRTPVTVQGWADRMHDLAGFAHMYDLSSFEEPDYPLRLKHWLNLRQWVQLKMTLDRLLLELVLIIMLSVYAFYITKSSLILLAVNFLNRLYPEQYGRQMSLSSLTPGTVTAGLDFIVLLGGILMGMYTCKQLNDSFDAHQQHLDQLQMCCRERKLERLTEVLHSNVGDDAQRGVMKKEDVELYDKVQRLYDHRDSAIQSCRERLSKYDPKQVLMGMVIDRNFVLRFAVGMLTVAAPIIADVIGKL